MTHGKVEMKRSLFKVIFKDYVTFAFQSESRMASLAKWLSVHLRTKWLRVRVPLQSLNILYVTVLLIWILVVLFILLLVVLIYPLVVLVCPLGVLVYSLVVLVCQLVVLVCPFVCLLVVLACPPLVSTCPLVVLAWPFMCPLVVLVVLSVGLFLTDSYNDNKMIIFINII